MKKVSRVLLILAFLGMGMGVVLGLVSYPTLQKVKNGETTDINDVTADSLQEGELVTGEFNYVLDCFAEEYETHFGIRSSDDSTKQYYLLWLNESYLIYEIANDDIIDDLDTACQQTWDMLDESENGTPEEELTAPTTFAKVQGEVIPMDSEIKGYCLAWFHDNTDWTDEEIEEALDDCILQGRVLDEDTLNQNLMIGIIGGAIGLLLLIISIVIMVKENRAKAEDIY